MLVLEEQRPYASNKAATGGSFMRIILSLFSLSISPHFDCAFRGNLEIVCSL